MTPIDPIRPNLPSLQDLMLRYLDRQANAEEGEWLHSTGEVEPYSVSVGIPVEPRVAWQDAQLALSFPRQPGKVVTPPEWANWVHSAGQETAIAFAAGNFPQDVQDLSPLVESLPLSRLQPRGVDHGPVSKALRTWVDTRIQSGTVSDLLLAAGVLRRAGAYEQAALVLRQLKSTAAPEHRPHVLNEEAALCWHRGEAEEALRLWEIAGDSVPAMFNRGMALLFLDRASEARPLLRKATEQLPETSAWHHLAGLYAALAEMRTN